MPALTIMIKPVSGRCDMRCRYCFYADEMRCRAGEKPAVMREDILEKAVRRVLRCAEGSAGPRMIANDPENWKYGTEYPYKIAIKLGTGNLLYNSHRIIMRPGLFVRTSHGYRRIRVCYGYDPGG